jgi:hypothetical protein
MACGGRRRRGRRRRRRRRRRRILMFKKFLKVSAVMKFSEATEFITIK